MSVEEKRRVAAAELEQLRSTIEREIGRPAQIARWVKPAIGLLGGLALAFTVKRSLDGLRARGRSDRELGD